MNDERSFPAARAQRDTPRPRRFSYTLTVIFAAMAIGLADSALRRNLPASALLLASCTSVVVAFIFVRRGHTQRGAAWLVGTLTPMILSLAWVGQGLRDEVICAVPGLMVLASMFASRRSYVMTVTAALAIPCLIALGDTLGLRPNAPGTNTVGTLINLLSILFATAYFIGLMSGDLRRALARLANENEQIRESHARVDAMAHHDALTGLANRTLVRRRFLQAADAARGREEAVALLFLDLDNFKQINDRLGHAVGDQMLREVGKRLVAAARSSDTVGRIGGDEFVIIMGALAETSAAETVAAKIIRQLSAPVEVEGNLLRATGSLGVALFPQDGESFEALLANADKAMYQAKGGGRNAYCIYTGTTGGDRRAAADDALTLSK